MNWLFTPGGQILEFQLQLSVLLINIQGLISFRIDWFDLLACQRTLKSLLQHHNLKASILWCSAFFMVQLSHPYVSTGKTIALTIYTFIGKMMSLLSNTLSRFIIGFLPRSYQKMVPLPHLHSPTEIYPHRLSWWGRAGSEV